MKRKIFALALALTMIFSMIPLTAVAADDAPATTPGTAKVATLDGTDLTLDALIAAMTAADFDGYAGKTLTLTTDIVVNGWITVATFKGTLDGAGHKISGLNNPLFTAVTDATIQNIIVEGKITATGKANVGLIGESASGTVTLTNCVTNGTLAVHATTAVNAGCFFGTSANLILTNCTNNCNLEVTKDGTAKAEVHTYVGGFVGTANGDITADCCVNVGSMISNTTSSKTCLVGGFVGQHVATGTNKTVAFSKCANYGIVSANGDSGGTKAGGFFSVLNQWDTAYSFVNCVNKGDVTAFSIAGGLFADGRGEIICDHSYNFGNIKATSNISKVNAIAGGIGGQTVSGNANTKLSVIRNCVNDGAVSTPNGTASTTYAAGILGICAFNFAEFENNVVKGSVSSKLYAAGLIGKMAIGSSKPLDSTFSDNYVFATVEGASGKVGGIVAFNQSNGSATVKACYYLNTIPAAVGGQHNTYNAIYQADGYADNTKDLKELAAKTEADMIATMVIRNVNVQSSVVVENKFNMRFVAGIDGLGYSKTGFELVCVELNGMPSGTLKKETATVYTSVKGYDATGKEITYTAEDLQAEYLTAVAVNNIPADKTVTFLLRPYVISADGETTLYGAVCSVTYSNGTLVTE